jgi:hypothetical protein
MRQELKDKFAMVARDASSQIDNYRAQLEGLSMDVRSQMQQVHQDQFNTIKRILYRIQTVRRTLPPHHFHSCSMFLFLLVVSSQEMGQAALQW